MPLLPALRKHSGGEFEAGLGYKQVPGEPGLLHRETISQKNQEFFFNILHEEVILMRMFLC